MVREAEESQRQGATNGRTVGGDATLLVLKMAKGCHEPRSVGVSGSWKRPERTSRREQSLVDPLILALRDPCQTSVLQNIKVMHLWSGSHHICSNLL